MVRRRRRPPPQAQNKSKTDSNPMLKMQINSLYRTAVAAVALLQMSLANLPAEDKPVSYYREVFPVFNRSCNGCHHPAKLKGQLDLTSYQMFKKGGKHGPGFVAGQPKESIIMEEISGAEPSMPKEGDPLTKPEIALIERWILDGAKDDTPADAGSTKLTEAPTYAVPPVISAMAF